MILYVFDRRWGYPAFPAQHKKTAIVDTFYVDSSHSIETIAVFIAKRSEKHKRKIDLLRLCGHGNTGYLQLGKGLDQASAKGLKKVASVMATGATVEIHGCGVASATDVVGPSSTLNNPQCIPGTDAANSAGRRFLRAVAVAIKRPVKGGIDCQLGDTKYNFEGNTVIEYPPVKTPAKAGKK